MFNSPKKFCIVTGALSNNGTGYIAKNLGERLNRNGCKCFFFVIGRDTDKTKNSFAFNSVKWGSRSLKKKIMLRMCHYISFFWFIVANKIDLVYVSSSAFSSEALLSKILLRSVVFHVNEGVNYISKREPRVSMACYFSDKTIFGSVYTSKIFSDLVKKRSVVIYNGVYVHPLKVRNREILRVGTLGSVDSNKNQIDLVRELDKYNRIFRKNISLAICGQDTDMDYAYKLEQCIKNSNISVSRMQSIKSIDAFFESIDLLIIASKDECFPTVMLEAAAYSVPVLANNVGGISEFIEHQKTGFLYSSKVDGDFSRVLDLICSQDDLMPIVCAAYESVSSNYNLDDAFNKLLYEVVSVS